MEERESGDAAEVRRTDGDIRYGVFITTAGLTVIGVGEADAAGSEPASVEVPPVSAVAETTKAAMVLALLRRPHGAILAELTETTGWLPYPALLRNDLATSLLAARRLADLSTAQRPMPPEFP